jgi:hypothetical protein
MGISGLERPDDAGACIASHVCLIKPNLYFERMDSATPLVVKNMHQFRVASGRING